MDNKLPAEVEERLSLLGENLKLARRRRRETQTDFAKRIGVTRQTLAEMERGSPLTTIGNYAMALWVIGMSEDLAQIAHPDRDIQGKVAEREMDPMRVRGEAPDTERYKF